MIKVLLTWIKMLVIKNGSVKKKLSYLRPNPLKKIYWTKQRSFFPVTQEKQKDADLMMHSVAMQDGYIKT